MRNQSPSLNESYLSVARAAKDLGLHPSTIRRWIDQGKLPAYRLGEKRLGIKPSDLASVVVPKPASAPSESDRIVVEPYTPEEIERGLRAGEELDRLAQEDFERRGRKLYPPSWKLIDKMRRERTKALMNDP